MSFLQRILCRLGFHTRSRRQAKRTEAGWKSVCRGCNRPMIKLKGGDWRAMRKAPELTRAERAEVRKADARRRRMPPPRRKRPSERG
jgi:hypothetical protein